MQCTEQHFYNSIMLGKRVITPQTYKNVISMKTTATHWKIRDVLNSADSDSVLSGSISYSTELSEDDEVLSEASSMLDDTEEVHPYLFEPEQSSSESDAENTGYS